MWMSSRLASKCLSALKAKYRCFRRTRPSTSATPVNRVFPGILRTVNSQIAYATRAFARSIGLGRGHHERVTRARPSIVMKYDQFHFTDVTKEFLAASVQPVKLSTTNRLQITITPAGANAAKSTGIDPRLENADVTCHYT